MCFRENSRVVKLDLISLSANKYKPLKHILITGDIARKWSNYDSHARGQKFESSSGHHFCTAHCSNFAETCPQCGRFFRTFKQGQIQVRPGDGWSLAVFWGIMLAWIIPTIVCIALIVVLFVIGGLTAASLMPRIPSQTPSSRP